MQIRSLLLGLLYRLGCSTGAYGILDSFRTNSNCEKDSMTRLVRNSRTYCALILLKTFSFSYSSLCRASYLEDESGLVGFGHSRVWTFISDFKKDHEELFVSFEELWYNINTYHTILVTIEFWNFLETYFCSSRNYNKINWHDFRLKRTSQTFQQNRY